jgi:hypothetical protein
MALEDDEDPSLKESVLSCLKPLQALEEQNTLVVQSLTRQRCRS